MAGDKPNVSVESLLARLVTGSVELINDLQLKRACHEYMSSLSPEGFEFFVADLMRSMGWQAQLTRQSADDGVDVLCVNEEGLRCAVQCKRYSKKVSVEMVRELEGAKVLFNCDEAILATTDTFTANAYDTADKLNIKLLNGDLIAFHAAPLLNLN
jgi:restriction system protein